MDTTLTHMSTGSKTEISASNFETDVEEIQHEPSFRVLHLVDSARLGLTVLALAAGITILGVSADAIAVYNATHVPDDFLLPLWPANFDLRPTVALVVGSVLVMLANALSLVVSKIPTVRHPSASACFFPSGLTVAMKKIRSNAGVKMTLVFAPPIIAFVAAIISMSFFYAVNASTTADSFQSWTCRWRDVAMTTQPHFGTLCKQSWAGVVLSVMLVPVEAIILGLAAYQFSLERRVNLATRGPGRKAGSPALS
ncbi:hypothetical protein FALBO_16142 [Fusarium albosuccineum]|uniref:Uncharacterized protein n=1 Tax=Fusarium albosuccineum TaxID=1237068 RepID=A0A8H4KMP4_9HYPO|nr:hypothetical protein FALBO_16142 [Fusarium albosuccineum]